jgi:hypothetical protein
LRDVMRTDLMEVYWAETMGHCSVAMWAILMADSLAASTVLWMAVPRVVLLVER